MSEDERELTEREKGLLLPEAQILQAEGRAAKAAEERWGAQRQRIDRLLVGLFGEGATVSFDTMTVSFPDDEDEEG